MKIKLYFGRENTIKKSGIGRAFIHQKKALELTGIPYTVDFDDLDYDILHINTVWPDSYRIINQARKNNKKSYIMLIVLKRILEILYVF
ncbi:hypothetical protein SD457_05370 [Coprobacillaceae bacterium CR2/5/TPMF4]|nr:hypothetical protein SD457_05370 [Coprobacillaceae bacterium CR2/5/TPMF4]